jgi:hypothetical protein
MQDKELKIGHVRFFNSSKTIAAVAAAIQSIFLMT